MRRPLICLVLVALTFTACADDQDDGRSSPESTTGAAACSAPEEPAADEIALAQIGSPTFVTGDASPALFAGGHDHSGALVEPGEAHVHECLVISNGGRDEIVVQAIQILPAEGEEAYGLYEADALAEEFGADNPADDVIAPGQAVALELLAPVDPDAPPDAIRHRVAYTVMTADGGRRDLFVESDPIGVTR